MYKIIGADHREYGPVTKEQLIAWIAQGRANSATPVQAEGATEWKPISAFPEFEAALRSTTPPPPIGEAPVEFHPEQILERDYKLEIGNIVGRAIELLKRDFAILFATTAILLGIQLAIALLSGIPFFGVVFSLANLFIQGPLIAGAYLIFLRRIRGQATDTSEIFSGFGPRFLQLMLAQIVPTIITVVASLPGIIMLVVGIIFTTQHTPAAGVPLIVIGATLSLVITWFLWAAWCFALPLTADKQIDFWPAMQLSRRMTSKHFLSVFLFLVVLALINLIGLVFCGIGLFFTLPVGIGALMYAYETIFTGSQPAPVTSSQQTL